MFDYGIGALEDVDEERGVVMIRRGASTVSYSAEDRSQLGGLRRLERVEFQVLHDGSRAVLTEIRSLGDESDQAGEPPACISFRYSGQGSLSDTAHTRSYAPPRRMPK